MYLNEKVLNLVYSKEPLFSSCKIIKKELGNLLLPSGKIIANDPLVFFETQPFLVTVPPGEYPVTIFIMEEPQFHDKRVALACVYFSQKKAQKWEMALTSPEEDITTLQEGYFFGYGVDSGTGGFMDEKVAQYLDAMPDEDREELFCSTLVDEMDKTYEHTYCYLNYPFEKAKGNAIYFSSGYGDGSYPSYFGYDEDGQVCSLVTDFCILREDA